MAAMAMEMEIDCSNYDSDRCKKGHQLTFDNDMEEIVVLACWGVYCQSGKYNVYKRNDEGKIKKSEVIRGQKDVFEGIAQYSSKAEVSDVYFAGDNIYNYAYPIGQDPSEIGFLIDKQLESFDECYADIDRNVKRTFVGIGNHDVENCEVLNKQLNFGGWHNTGVYFSVNYKRSENRGVTIIVIDTNVFDPKQETCNGNEQLYTQVDREKQLQFIEKSYKEAKSRSDWIVIIGHIPALANGHKLKKDSIVVKNKEVYKIIEKYRPHIYICGDEHNQQFIYDMDIGVSLAVVGSGGTNLDPIYYKTSDDLKAVPVTCYAEQVFGFIVLKFEENDMYVRFKTTVIVDDSYIARINYEDRKVIETMPIDCSEVLRKMSDE